MCGIVGVITNHSNGFSMDEAKVFRDMLLIDTLRGFDSTGVFGVDNYSNVEILKEASNGASFVQTTEYKAFDNWIIQHGVFAVGHNRAATRGSITDKNAHPFHVEDNIVLVQNGTYKGDHTHHKNTDVDTEAVAHVIHENPDIETALQKINAAYALVWYNVKDKTLSIIRNEERPLYIAYTPNNSVFFASEMETILAACSRNNVVLREKPYLIKENMLNTWTLVDENATWEYNSKAIDNKFRNTEHPFRQYDYSTWEIGTRWKPPIVPAIEYQAHRPTQPYEIVNSMFELIHRGEFMEYMMTIKDAETYKESLQNKKSLNVEMYDYKPCNTYPNCRAWYALCKVLDPSDKVSAVIYGIIKDKTELEVIEMSENTPFYSVDIPGTPLEHSVLGLNMERGRIISLFVHNFQPIAIQ